MVFDSRFLFIAACLFALLATPFLLANEIVRIEVGEAPIISEKKNVKQLRKRVRQLERAVKQLQDKVYAQSTVTTKTYTCYIRTPFDGTHVGNGKSEIEARGNTLQKCEKSNSGGGCVESNLQCGASEEILSR